MEEMIYLKQLDFATLQQVVTLCDKLGYFPSGKELAVELGIPVRKAHAKIHRLQWVGAIDRDDKGRWHVRVRPEDFKDNLRDKFQDDDDDDIASSIKNIGTIRRNRLAEKIELKDGDGA